MSRTPWLLGVVVLTLLPATSMASSVTVGDIELNNLFAGVNVFTVNNFTGSNNLGFFPVADDVVFTDLVLTATESDSTVLTFNLADLGPGSDTTSTVSDALLFTQVVLSATLSPATFTLTNGDSGTFVANPVLSFTLLPSSGSFLVAGTDSGTFDAQGVPEPSQLALLGLGLIVIATFRR